MSSYFGVEIVPGYGAAKAGVVQTTKTLAVAWATDGIRVNAVAPGVVETAMTEPMMSLDEMTAPLLARTPLGRFAQPAEIAPAVLFLASPQARYITGHTLAVDGGFSIAG
jgi:NAD(P)-dependent dehydrogenase (short-subunit alcohol dehydrogenase family)